MNWALSVISFFGAIGFFIAWYYSNKNHEITKYASQLWFLFGVSMMFGFLWAFTTLVGGWMIDLSVVAGIEEIFLTACSAMLFGVAYISFSSHIKLM